MTSFAKTIAAERPEEIALRDPRQALTWLDVDNVLNRAANAIRLADTGPDLRIAVFAENGVETALANLGGLIGGASVVPINFHLTAEEVAYILSDSGARMVFLGPETAERGLEAAALAGIDQIIGWRCEIPGLKSWSEWLAASSPEDLTQYSTETNLLYTQHHGRPKGTHLPPPCLLAATL